MTEFQGRNFSLASVKSGWLRGLGHFARASLPLPDLWRRPSERTTDCRMAPIWPEHHWQLSTSGGSDCMGVSERTEDTLSIIFKRSDYLTWQQLCLLIEFLTSFIQSLFDFWQTLRCILQKLHTIVWNSCGYPYVKLYLIRWSFTHGIAKSLGGSLFSGHSVDIRSSILQFINIQHCYSQLFCSSSNCLCKMLICSSVEDVTSANLASYNKVSLTAQLTL